MLMNVEVGVADAAVAPPGASWVLRGRARCFWGLGNLAVLGEVEFGAPKQWEWSLGATPGNVEALGAVLYTKFLFPFEVASILLLAAMIGAIVLAKRTIER